MDKRLFTDGVDIVIAGDVQDAVGVWQMETGDLRTPEFDGPFSPVPGGQLVKLAFAPWGNFGMPDITNIQIPDNALIEPVDGEFYVTATAYAWASVNKKCILSQS